MPEQIPERETTFLSRMKTTINEVFDVLEILALRLTLLVLLVLGAIVIIRGDHQADNGKAPDTHVTAPAR